MAEKAGIRRVAVTGASGFIGRALVAALAAEGVAVTALSRSPMPRGTGTNLRLIAGDLRDADSVARLLEGADTLYNLAYDVRASGADNLRPSTRYWPGPGRPGRGGSCICRRWSSTTPGPMPIASRPAR
ncbi:MAG: NAD-dependent epimerase/dehydratase family protein [Defluviimonas denitrificans]